jgi:hypothetical protein
MYREPGRSISMSSREKIIVGKKSIAHTRSSALSRRFGRGLILPPPPSAHLCSPPLTFYAPSRRIWRFRDHNVRQGQPAPNSNPTSHTLPPRIRYNKPEEWVPGRSVNADSVSSFYPELTAIMPEISRCFLDQ